LFIVAGEWVPVPQHARAADTAMAIVIHAIVENGVLRLIGVVVHLLTSILIAETVYFLLLVAQLVNFIKQILAKHVPVAVTALVVHPVVCIPQLRVLRGPMQVERQHVNHVVPVNIRQPPEEPIVIFAVLANIRQTPEEQPIVIKIALPARTKLRYNWSV
jgi:hypothetical protein